MRSIIAILTLHSVFFLSAAKAQSCIEKAKELFLCLKSGNYTKIETLMDTNQIVKYAGGLYKEACLKTIEKTGKPKKIIADYQEEAGIKTRVALALQFKKEKRLLVVLFNPQKKIESYQLEAFTEQPFFQLKGYKGFSEVTDLYTTVKTSNGLTLGANISFGDTSKQKSPLVILVHGSGPNDRDETLGPNKPFRDLAQGLAQQGIVCLRYDKRTFAYQYDKQHMHDSLTIYEETINDAIDAVKSASQYTFVDTSRIYIIGHSLGAMCAPKIAALCPAVKGIIMMAAPVNNLVDLIPEQIEYIAGLDDSISTAEQMQITSVKWMADKIKSPGLSNKTPKAMLMGAPAAYWKSILNYDQLKTAQSLSIPVLILNGERDYQVPVREFELWKTNLKNNTNFSFKSYPLLNHLFLEGTGKSRPEEYNVPEHIPQYVIDDLVQFIK